MQEKFLPAQLNCQATSLTDGSCDKYTRLKVRTNADTPRDAEVARSFGATGIGLCRTEHMFFDNQKIIAMREMILAPDVEGRKKALAKLLPYQKADFKGIFKAMERMSGERTVCSILLCMNSYLMI